MGEKRNKEIVELLLERSKIKLDDCYMLKKIDLMQLKVRDANDFYYRDPSPDNEINLILNYGISVAFIGKNPPPNTPNILMQE